MKLVKITWVLLIAFDYETETGLILTEGIYTLDSRDKKFF